MEQASIPSYFREADYLSLMLSEILVFFLWSKLQSNQVVSQKFEYYFWGLKQCVFPFFQAQMYFSEVDLSWLFSFNRFDAEKLKWQKS